MSSGKKVLVVGSGAREHALAWKLVQSPGVAQVLVAPGNAGIAGIARCVAVAADDVPGLVALARAESVGLVVVGPEGPLVAGLIDALDAAGIAAFGPSKEAARLEGSKAFAKEIMREAGVPTAGAERCADAEAVRAALRRFGAPHVVKADGLAAGKGVLVTSDTAEAERFARGCLDGGAFGESGRSVVIEEFLAGEEASVIAVCDGAGFALLPAARDDKRAADGDAGPNTGGMGAYAPTPAVTPAVEAEVGERVVAPVLRVMAARGTPYRGALYCGLMLGAGGAKVVEFNARFGDPETQSIVPLVTGSFAALLAGAARGALDSSAVARAAGGAVTVALVDRGYPGDVRGGGVIDGLDRLEERGVTVFHAGTRREDERWVVRGGRAAYVTAARESIEEARAAVYAACSQLSGDGWRCRGDIAATVAGAGAPAGGRTA